MNFNAAALAYVRFVLEQMHISPHALATGAGIAPSTLSRALNDPKHKFSLSGKTIEKIAEFSGINPGAFLEAQDVAQLSTEHMFRPDVFNKEKWGEQGWSPASEQDQAGPRVTMFAGVIESGKWKEPTVLDWTYYPPVLYRHSSYASRDCFACYVKGDSADLFAQDGDTLYCIRLEASGRTNHRVRHVVVVQTERRDQFMIELSCRIIDPKAGGGWVMHGASKSKEYHKPVFIQDLTAAKSMKILGIVDCVLRYPEQTLYDLALKHD